MASKNSSPTASPPVKNVGSATIHRSIHSCYHNILDFLVQKLTPGWTVFFELDETLVYSKLEPSTEKFDFVVRPRIDGKIVPHYVLKRPGLDKFLEALVAERFDIGVFTSASKEYASPVIDHLDKKSLISHRLYRDSCTEVDGIYAKDLSRAGLVLSRVVIVESIPNSYCFQPKHMIPIAPFIGDPADRELHKLVKFFKLCGRYDDIRVAVKIYLDQSESKFNC